MDTDRTSDRATPRRHRRAALAICGLVLAVAGMLPGTAPLRATAAGSDDAVSYRIDPAHSGAQPGDTLAPPLIQRWSVDLGGNVSYPLIAGGRIFVTAADANYGSRLYALDPSTGATLWGPVELGGTYWFSASAYDGGRVFTVNHDGLLRAFDAATGTQVWSVQLPGQYSFTSPPTALNGVVYTGGAGSGGTVYAVSESSGAVLWTQPVMNGDSSAPAVSAGGVYVTYACQQDYAFDPVQGTPLWHHSTGCEGGGGATAALSGGRLYDLNSGYVNGASTGPVVLDATTGAEVGSFTASQAPAFDAGLGFFLSGGTLRAITLSTGAVDWSFAGDGTLDAAPVVAGGQVYVTGSSGMLYAVGETSGAQTWAQSIAASSSGCGLCPPGGLAVGEGMLAAPFGTRISGFTTMTAPVVTGVSPGSGPVAGGVAVTVSGSGFSQGVTSVRFGGVAAASVTVVSDTRLTAVSPPLASGTVDVTVSDAAGSSAASAADRFTVVAPPTVTSVCPPSGTTRGGTVVTLTGANLAGVTAVRFGSVAATGVTALSSTSVRVTTPAEAAATVPVSVTTSAGGTGTGPATYTFTSSRKTAGC